MHERKNDLDDVSATWRTPVAAPDELANVLEASSSLRFDDSSSRVGDLSNSRSLKCFVRNLKRAACSDPVKWYIATSSLICCNAVLQKAFRLHQHFCCCISYYNDEIMFDISAIASTTATHCCALCLDYCNVLQHSAA